LRRKKGRRGATAACAVGLRHGTALALICWLSVAAQARAAPPSGPPAKMSADAADTAEAAEEARDEILVTAQKQHGAVATDVPPEVNLTSTAIRALGAADLQEVFEDLAPEIRTGGSEPGKALPTPVVLVNGQRIAGFSSIKDLPPEAIRRIEIFPEKVALQYGYGAGQRVVNVVLRSRYHALTLLGRYTVAPSNWRGIYRAKADLVRIGERAHWSVDLDYRHEDPLFADTTLAGPPDVAASSVPAHTTASQGDHLAFSGAAARSFGALSAELTGRLELDGLQGRPGLAAEDGAILAQEGLADLISGPLKRSDRTADASAGLTLNGTVRGWRWSFVGRLDETTRITRTGDAASSGRFEAILLPSPTMLGKGCTGSSPSCAATNTREAGGDLYLNGPLLRLPAGDVTAALRAGFAFSDIGAEPSAAGQAARLARGEGSARADLDIPLTARTASIGKLSIDLDGEMHRLSDFGTLSTVGSTLDWTPGRRVSILASVSRAEQAPSLLQLGEAELETPDLRVYDFVNGATAIVRRIEGGNGDLVRQVARSADLRVQITPLRSADLMLSAEYRIEHVRNPIAALTAATDAAMAAFPGRFVRSDGGYLTAINVSPVNLDRRDRQQIRWGLTYSTPFGAARPAKGGATARNQFQIALYDTWRFQDDVILRAGQPRLDLLNGGILSDMGGTPAHQIDLQTTVSTASWSAAINAAWQSRTTAEAGTSGDERLRFSQGITLNMRVQINLGRQRWLTSLVPWLRGNLNLSGDNLLGAHTKVHDASGAVPLAYSESYLNPTGRTFRITLRKRFR